MIHLCINFFEESTKFRSLLSVLCVAFCWRRAFILFTQGLQSVQKIAKQKHFAFHLLHIHSAFSDCTQRCITVSHTFLRNSFSGLGVASGPTFGLLTLPLNALQWTLVLSRMTFSFSCFYLCIYLHGSTQVQTPKTANVLLTTDACIKR